MLVDGVSVGAVTNYTFMNVTADHAISAAFAVNTYTITATAGAGGGIVCVPPVVDYGSGSTCTITPDIGYHVLDVLVDGLTVGPLSTYTFTNVTADHAVSAAFAVNTYTITVAKAGTGTGTVTSAPAGISCGADCSAVYDYGTSITLTAIADPDSVFEGWTGACSGGGTCTFAADSDRTVSATFERAITITSPNGGEAWVRGMTYAITWTYAGDPGTVTIELLQAGLPHRVLASGVPVGSNGTGSYDWFIPKNEWGSDYTIRITSVTNGAFTDMGDGTFSISK